MKLSGILRSSCFYCNYYYYLNLSISVLSCINCASQCDNRNTKHNSSNSIGYICMLQHFCKKIITNILCKREPLRLPSIKLCAHCDPANPQHDQLSQHLRARFHKNHPPLWESRSAPVFQHAGKNSRWAQEVHRTSDMGRAQCCFCFQFTQMVWVRWCTALVLSIRCLYIPCNAKCALLALAYRSSWEIHKGTDSFWTTPFGNSIRRIDSYTRESENLFYPCS